jgi:hypothetical protein
LSAGRLESTDRFTTRDGTQRSPDADVGIAAGSVVASVDVLADVVTIVKMANTGPDQSDTSMEAAAERENAVSAEPEHLLPQRYASPLQSGLEETVTESGPNEFKFELTD